MKTVLEKLQELGRMPNEDLDNDPPTIQNIVNEYEQLLDEIEEPISMEEGWFLITILPSKEFYGLDEVIQAKIETIELNDDKSKKEYEKLINACLNEDIRSNLIGGYKNWLKEESNG
jgi:hypothetical protein